MTDILTKNFAQLQAEVAHHVHADSIIQRYYWEGEKGCFIGCLSHSDDPAIAVERFGLTLPIMRIAESIFEGLPDDEAKAFFAAFPTAIERDGKDLSRVHWQFLAAELRALPQQGPSIQAVIDRVIVGMDLLSNGQSWAAADAADAANVARAAADVARAAARATYAADAAYAAYAAARASDASAYAAYDAADAADAACAAARVARAAAYAAHAAVRAAAYAASDAADAADAARRRQRDTLLRLIKDTQ